MADKLWTGRSLFNSGRIKACVSRGSRNVKTGNLDTLWILCADQSPMEAVKTGADSAVCGDCPHRRGHGKLGDCFVLLFQAPQSVHKSTEENK